MAFEKHWEENGYEDCCTKLSSRCETNSLEHRKKTFDGPPFLVLIPHFITTGIIVHLFYAKARLW